MHPDLLAAASGVGLGLIVAIGAQNAFVLRQGLRGEHVLAVVAVCAVSDVLLITAGVAGTGALLDRVPEAVTEAAQRTPLLPTVLTASALTWLDPHVYSVWSAGADERGSA